MGTYINKGNKDFRDIISHEFIDKSELILAINETLNSERRYSCVTRCRRFGKSMAAKMLRAYYDKSCNSLDLFNGLKAIKDDSFVKFLNKYPVIYLDITDFTTKYRNASDLVDKIQSSIIEDILRAYPETYKSDSDDLMDVLYRICETTGEEFIMIIDEWDAIFREMGGNEAFTIQYVDFLRRLFKGSGSNTVFAGVYITGILPIKKYNTESALNNFWEYSMVDPGNFASFYGFTEKEVKMLADKNNVDIEALKIWYDGYQIGSEDSIYNPYSVVQAIARRQCKNYWATTSAYDKIVTYIQMNFNGLKDAVIQMLAGDHIPVETSMFQNDINIVSSKDDVLTALIHLGYLAYNSNKKECYIPNREVADELSNAIRNSNWAQLANTIQDSQNLLVAAVAGNEEAVARGIELAHDENTSILSYNDENSLACVLAIAFIWAKNEYIIHRELATGKGYADLVLIPRKNIDKPAMVIELKYDNSANTAITQIKQKQYFSKIAEYTGDIVLVGIDYDKRTKLHSCKIEKHTKR